MGQLMRNGMLHRRPFTQRGPAAFGPELGAQFLLEDWLMAGLQGSEVHGCAYSWSRAPRVFATVPLRYTAAGIWPVRHP
jgi:hypothetical protein